MLCDQQRATAGAWHRVIVVRLFDVQRIDRYLVHRHGMCVVIRMYVGIRVSLLGGAGEAPAGALAPATMHAPAYITQLRHAGTARVVTYPGCVHIGAATATLSGALYQRYTSKHF